MAELKMSPARALNALINSAAYQVWETRARMGKRWLAPGAVHSAWFAATEIGEVAQEINLLAMQIVVPYDQATVGARAHTSALALYAKTARAIDARMREFDEYSRNNTRVIDLFDELGDVAIMLITALGQGYDYEIAGYELALPPTREVRIGDVLGQASLATILISQVHAVPRGHVQAKLQCAGLSWQDEAHEAVSMIFQYFFSHGMSPAKCVLSRLERIEAKHGNCG